MDASRFSADVLEMFYGSISNAENQRLRPAIRPWRRFDFEIERNDFNQWLRVWKMAVLDRYRYKADLGICEKT